MTLFDLLYHDERYFILSRKNLKISTVSPKYRVLFNDRIIERVPYYLLKKRAYKIVPLIDCIEVFVK